MYTIHFSADFFKLLSVWYTTKYRVNQKRTYCFAWRFTFLHIYSFKNQPCVYDQHKAEIHVFRHICPNTMISFIPSWFHHCLKPQTSESVIYHSNFLCHANVFIYFFIYPKDFKSVVNLCAMQQTLEKIGRFLF